MPNDWSLVAAACIVGVLIGAAVAFTRRGAKSGRLLELTLNNMTQGVVMFDAAGRLVVCNW